VRTVVVGLGWVAREVWLPRLLAHPKFTLVAAVETNPDAAGAVSGVPVYGDCADVPLDDVDLAFVLTPNHTHGRIGEWFLRRGRSVFLEKPTGTDRAQLDLLDRAARSGGGRLVLSAAARHRADIRELARLVSDGFCGTPRLAELSWVRARGIPTGGWFTDRATAGGGVLVDLGWHVIDVAQQIWGTSPVRAATAVAGDDFLRRRGWDAGWRGGPAHPTGGDVEDQLTGLVVTDPYAMALRFAWASHEETDETRIALHGTEGSVELRTTFGFSPRRVTPSLVARRGGERTDIPLPGVAVGDEYDRQLGALVGLMEEPGATARALAEAYAVLAVVDACYRSAGVL
jgi:oxidoreductase